MQITDERSPVKKVPRYKKRPDVKSLTLGKSKLIKKF